MSASLVGSEMCIRDRIAAQQLPARLPGRPPVAPLRQRAAHQPGPLFDDPVSYTHLTLPTICSV
eukprot:4361753-Alexandrium_andersonii.AAC.1